MWNLIASLLVYALVMAAAFGVPVYLILRFLRAYERRSVAGRSEDPRVEALEAQIELMSGEIERLTEGQQFTERLLERPIASPLGQRRVAATELNRPGDG